ncbi:ArnT family glycosyltransferase [Dyadobacter fermentans]|uniref:ArnT family glycosyltransferase n=1 Tax=Dyadobacter fermentans TaxID=94254 RepID=UPI001CC0297F|nr:glycosyltransferase family 39 protein [Dyadobacter fermentans]MBZ1361820.1 glycosyltransferase family 39 protein [Dyadobacter fermentans]
MIFLIPTAMGLATANCYVAFYRNVEQPFRRSLISAAILIFLFIACSTEVLGLFKLINRVAIAVSWALLDIALAITWFRLKSIHGLTFPTIAKHWLNGTRNFCQELGTFTIAMLAVLSSVTLVVAIAAIPNNQDSLSYHLSRLGYWIQQGNVAHYASHIERSISFSPFSEYVHLHTFLLSGSERYFQLLQWGCLAGVLALISMIIRLFSNSPATLRIGLCFAATLPIVVLESMTTQNDLVVAFFILATVFFVFDYIRNNHLASLYLIPLCCAVGMMTKGTFLFYVLPFGTYLLISMLRKPVLRKHIVTFTAASLILTLALNVPYWYRTYEIFASPVGTISSGNQNTFTGPTDYISSVSKHTFLHLGFVSPGNRYNDFLLNQLRNLHTAMGIPLDVPRLGMPFKMNKLNFNEDFAHNFFGIWLIIFSIPLLIFTRLPKAAKWYGWLTFLSILVFCFFISYQTYGSRLHIPFFLLAAPVVGLTYGSVLSAWSTRLLSFLLWVAALPFALLSSAHPFLSTKWFFEKIFPPINSALHLNIRVDAANLNLKQESVFYASPGRLFWGDHWPGTETLLKQVNALNPQKIGFVFTEASFDYAYQFLLRKPGRAFAHVRVANPSRVLEDPAFQPDVIIAEKNEGAGFDYHEKSYRLAMESDGKWLYVPIK